MITSVLQYTCDLSTCTLEVAMNKRWEDGESKHGILKDKILQE
ncbi:hypothetical protein [Vibrio gallaecicus]|nr:hypothetical protein [Vibrio gallaecicus]MDN3616366.1 hypothetical protein [Vibrio gallaecicus]